jgi:hypothetical protein
MGRALLTGQGITNRMPVDPGFIADALTRIRFTGWSIGDAAFFDVEHGSIMRTLCRGP